ncbi:MAG: 2-oxoacid:ferredoxin oxidoreductase subunit beta, partial [Myxococcales bacterium]|nr:2-oxoacid:ferredoxin oxidoreductase subunit beta [Myxococcales bacterium]
GFHSIHGRALTLATGLKLARPELSVWVITGDGDGLSIGGNHFIHALRRNIDINVILFNNRIYGLTKGQYSPTSEFGKKTKSSPLGNLDHPINPVRSAIAAEATWVGRSVDVETKHLPEMVQRMAEHRGVSFLEVYQNCNIFNNGAFDQFTERSVRAERVVYLEPGKPVRFGKDMDKGIRLRGLTPEVVTIGVDAREDEVLVHDATDASLAYLISRLDYPDFPVPLGVFVDTQREIYEDLYSDQVAQAKARPGAGDLQKLLTGSATWTVS